MVAVDVNLIVLVTQLVLLQLAVCSAASVDEVYQREGRCLWMWVVRFWVGVMRLVLKAVGGLVVAAVDLLPGEGLSSCVLILLLQPGAWSEVQKAGSFEVSCLQPLPGQGQQLAVDLPPPKS
jgi:hypothetical protein